jgi:hypothetical protein
MSTAGILIYLSQNVEMPVPGSADEISKRLLRLTRVLVGRLALVYDRLFSNVTPFPGSVSVAFFTHTGLLALLFLLVDHIVNSVLFEACIQ